MEAQTGSPSPEFTYRITSTDARNAKESPQRYTMWYPYRPKQAGQGGWTTRTWKLSVLPVITRDTIGLLSDKLDIPAESV